MAQAFSISPLMGRLGGFVGRFPCSLNYGFFEGKAKHTVFALGDASNYELLTQTGRMSVDVLRSHDCHELSGLA